MGYRTRIAAFLGGLLLLAFALGMAFGLGIKAPLNYSVFTKFSSAASFLLACASYSPWSLDVLLSAKSDAGSAYAGQALRD